jgi:general secretion pathway protein E
MSLCNILVRRGKATREQIAQALEQKVDRPDLAATAQTLIEKGVITAKDLLDALGAEFGCEIADPVEDDLLDPLLVAKLPVDWARANLLLPIRWKDGFGVLTCDPSNLSAIDDLGLLLGRDLVPVLAAKETILKAIESCYFRKQDSTQNLLNDMEEKERRPATRKKSRDDLLRVADQAPVTQLVNMILLDAVKAGASDVHIEPFETRVRIRIRIDGLLYEQAEPPKHMETGLVSRLKVMAKLDIAEKRLPQDGTARVRVGEREIDIRVSTIPVAEGERVVLRLLNRESTTLPLTALGMSPGTVEIFRNVIREPHGVILVTGPTGSGKTTTLYATLRELDTQHINVLTIEDPIEYQLPNVGQMQVKPKIGLTFAQGLRHILRQDPDVILVGETRDLETAEIVIRAALTGHLVFTTLHTNDATSAPLRLTDMGIPPYLLSSAIRASLAQRLARSLCPSCKIPHAATANEISAFGPAGRRLSGARIWKAKGCPNCLGGYKGRTGLFELMTMSAELQDDIRAGLSAQEFRRRAGGLGMKTLLDDVLDKVLAGSTSAAEALRVIGPQ